MSHAAKKLPSEMSKKVCSFCERLPVQFMHTCVCRVCLSVSMFMCDCRCLQSLEEGIRFPEAQVIGDCGLHVVGAWKQYEFSAGALCVFNY